MISLKEIFLSGSSSYIDDKFIDQQFKSVQKRITGRSFGKRCDWVIVTTGAGTKVFAIEKNSNSVKTFNPIAYAWIQPFRDGYVIKTIGVKSAYKGKGFGSLMYDKLIEIGRIYSDLNQTPQARKIWTKLSTKYKVMGYSDKDKKYFPVRLNGNELESADPKYTLYTRNQKENTNRLVVM